MSEWTKAQQRARMLVVRATRLEALLLMPNAPKVVTEQEFRLVEQALGFVEEEMTAAGFDLQSPGYLEDEATA